MATLDHSFCTRAEYRSGEPDRLQNDDLETGLLLNAMYELAGGPHDAAIIPARILAIDRRAVGRRVMFATLDADLQPTAHITGFFNNGYLDALATGTVVGDQLVIGTYFKGYDHGFDRLRVMSALPEAFIDL